MLDAAEAPAKASEEIPFLFFLQSACGVDFSSEPDLALEARIDGHTME